MTTNLFFKSTRTAESFSFSGASALIIGDAQSSKGRAENLLLLRWTFTGTGQFA
jgi:hypothetical protein